MPKLSKSSRRFRTSAPLASNGPRRTDASTPSPQERTPHPRHPLSHPLGAPTFMSADARRPSPLPTWTSTDPGRPWRRKLCPLRGGPLPTSPRTSRSHVKDATHTNLPSCAPSRPSLRPRKYPHNATLALGNRYHTTRCFVDLFSVAGEPLSTPPKAKVGGTDGTRTRNLCRDRAAL